MTHKFDHKMDALAYYRAALADVRPPLTGDLMFPEIASALNLHDSSCPRVCLNPKHQPDGGEVIDVQVVQERKLLK